MATDDQPAARFGCERCWPSAAAAAWEARGTLSQVAELVDQSHFQVMILGCSHCTQRFLSAFAETIDWADGDDPQSCTLLPLTDAEAADLLRRRDSLTEFELGLLGSGRRCLRSDFPKSAGPRIFWGTGNPIGPHD